MSAAATCPEPLRLRAGLTLDELLTRAHEDVQAYGAADCPVCDGTLTPVGTDAQCNACGSHVA